MKGPRSFEEIVRKTAPGRLTQPYLLAHSSTKLDGLDVPSPKRKLRCHRCQTQSARPRCLRFGPVGFAWSGPATGNAGLFPKGASNRVKPDTQLAPVCPTVPERVCQARKWFPFGCCAV